MENIKVRRRGNKKKRGSYPPLPRCYCDCARVIAARWLETGVRKRLRRTSRRQGESSERRPPRLKAASEGKASRKCGGTFACTLVLPSAGWLPTGTRWGRTRKTRKMRPRKHRRVQQAEQRQQSTTRKRGATPRGAGHAAPTNAARQHWSAGLDVHGKLRLLARASSSLGGGLGGGGQGPILGRLLG